MFIKMVPAGAIEWEQIECMVIVRMVQYVPCGLFKTRHTEPWLIQ